MRWLVLFFVLVAGCGDGNKVSTGSGGTGGAGGCKASAECDDGDPCTSDSCTVDGVCVHEPIAGCSFTGSGGSGGTGGGGGAVGGTAGTGGAPITCSDGVCEDVLAGQCFTSFVCSAGGLCVGVDKILGEDDGDACTHDVCNGSGWDHVAYTAAEIDDGDACTSDSCSAVNGVTHVPLTAAQLDDGNPCTTDSCTSIGGITHVLDPNCTATCAGVPIYAGTVAGLVSQWGVHPNANGKTGYDAGVEICKTIGADHPCEYQELKNAEAAGELANIAQGTTAWVHRTTNAIVNGMESQPGPGGRCNGWVYAGNTIADGEYVTFATVGVPTYHLDNDTFFDGIDTTHTIPNDLECGGETRNILCCSPPCP